MKHPTVNIKLTHKLNSFPVEALAAATFGDLKEYASEQTKIPPEGLQLLFRGRKRLDADVLFSTGVRNGSEIKIMETERYRQQKAQEQLAEHGGGPFLDFSEEAAAAARAAAAQGAQQEKATPPVAQASVRNKALQAIEGTCKEVDALEDQAQRLEAGEPGASRKAAGLAEMLTQKLLKLDNVVVDGDPEVRQQRKAVINRINRLCDMLEQHQQVGGGATTNSKVPDAA